MANPEIPLDAFLSRTDAYDYVNIFDEDSDFAQKQRETTHMLLDMTFPEPRALGDVEYACTYLNVMELTGMLWKNLEWLSRSEARWEETLEKQSEDITKAVLDRLRDFASSEAQRYNIALVLSGHHCRNNAASSSVFMERIAACLRSKTFYDGLKAQITPTLWVRDRRGAIERVVRQVLEQIADVTTDLVVAGTRETLDSLLSRGDPLDLRLSTDWNASIGVEFGRLL
ncbi:hypothetical protein FRC06_002161 [Ceratobasidium sp. 370]|nr:hypothetical protein FRC06_002161 [Ceratobasidium sp. 370]